MKIGASLFIAGVIVLIVWAFSLREPECLGVTCRQTPEAFVAATWSHVERTIPRAEPTVYVVETGFIGTPIKGFVSKKPNLHLMAMCEGGLRRGWCDLPEPNQHPLNP